MFCSLVLYLKFTVFLRNPKIRFNFSCFSGFGKLETRVDFDSETLSAVIMIDMVLVQNPLASFCCVLGKNTLRHFLLLGGLGKQF